MYSNSSKSIVITISRDGNNFYYTHVFMNCSCITRMEHRFYESKCTVSIFVKWKIIRRGIVACFHVLVVRVNFLAFAACLKLGYV